MVGDAGHYRMRARHGLAPTFVCARRETQRHRDDRRRTRHVPRPSLRANAVLVRATHAEPAAVDPDTAGLRVAHGVCAAENGDGVGATHWVALGHSCQRARSRLGQTNREAVPRDGGRRGASPDEGEAWPRPYGGEHFEHDFVRNLTPNRPEMRSSAQTPCPTPTEPRDLWSL